MIAILSIKPRYVEAILKGSKKYDFRKKPFKKDVKEILVYATKPIGKIVCKFYVKEIIEDKPENLWENLGDFSGLTKEEFFTYFLGQEKGIAIGIKNIEKFPEPIDPQKLFSNFRPPQSWSYLPSIEYLPESCLGDNNGKRQK